MLEEHATLAVFEDVPCIVYNGGVVRGFQLRVSNLHCMRDLSEPLVSAWTRMHELGILDGPADTDAHSLRDVATFLMLGCGCGLPKSLSLGRTIGR